MLSIGHLPPHLYCPNIIDYKTLGLPKLHCHIKLPGRCVCQIYSTTNWTDTFPLVRLARNNISVILDALSMRSDIIYFKLKLVIENPKYCVDLTHSISALPYLIFSLTKWLFDSFIDFVLLALTCNPHLAEYPYWTNTDPIHWRIY